MKKDNLHQKRSESTDERGSIIHGLGQIARIEGDIYVEYGS